MCFMKILKTRSYPVEAFISSCYLLWLQIYQCLLFSSAYKLSDKNDVDSCSYKHNSITEVCLQHYVYNTTQLVWRFTDAWPFAAINGADAWFHKLTSRVEICWRYSTPVIDRSQSEILVENRDFRSILGRSPSEYCRSVWHVITRTVDPPDGEKVWEYVCLLISTQYTNMTDRQTPDHGGVGSASHAAKIMQWRNVQYKWRETGNTKYYKYTGIYVKKLNYRTDTVRQHWIGCPKIFACSLSDSY